MATHSSILLLRIPWTDEPSRLWAVHGVAKSDTTERLCGHTHAHTHARDWQWPQGQFPSRREIYLQWERNDGMHRRDWGRGQQSQLQLRPCFQLSLGHSCSPVFLPGNLATRHPKVLPIKSTLPNLAQVWRLSLATKNSRLMWVIIIKERLSPGQLT